jgi:hypothetical protein
MMTRHEAAAVIGIEYTSPFFGTNWECADDDEEESQGTVSEGDVIESPRSGGKSVSGDED